MVSLPLDLVGGILMLMWSLMSAYTAARLIHTGKAFWEKRLTLALLSVLFFITSGALVVANSMSFSSNVDRAALAMLACSRVGVTYFNFTVLRQLRTDIRSHRFRRAMRQDSSTPPYPPLDQLPPDHERIVAGIWCVCFLVFVSGGLAILTSGAYAVLVVSSALNVLGQVLVLILVITTWIHTSDLQTNHELDKMHNASLAGLLGDVLLLSGAASQGSVTKYLRLFGRLFLALWMYHSLNYSKLKIVNLLPQVSQPGSLSVANSPAAVAPERTDPALRPRTSTGKDRAINETSPHASSFWTFRNPAAEQSRPDIGDNISTTKVPIKPKGEPSTHRHSHRRTTTPVRLSNAPSFEKIPRDVDFFAKGNISLTRPTEQESAASKLRHDWLMAQEGTIRGVSAQQRHAQPQAGESPGCVSFASSFSSDNALGLALEGAWPIRLEANSGTLNVPEPAAPNPPSVVVHNVVEEAASATPVRRAHSTRSQNSRSARFRRESRDRAVIGDTGTATPPQIVHNLSGICLPNEDEDDFEGSRNSIMFGVAISGPTLDEYLESRRPGSQIGQIRRYR